MKSNIVLTAIGHVMPTWLHAWFSHRSRWMFAAVWVRAQQRHVWRWVDEKQYYAGGQSI
jgi:hypothetical protein